MSVRAMGFRSPQSDRAVRLTYILQQRANLKMARIHTGFISTVEMIYLHSVRD